MKWKKWFVFIHCLLLFQSPCGEEHVKGSYFSQNFKSSRTAAHRMKMKFYPFGSRYLKTAFHEKTDKNHEFVDTKNKLEIGPSHKASTKSGPDESLAQMDDSNQNLIPSAATNIKVVDVVALENDLPYLQNLHSNEDVSKEVSVGFEKEITEKTDIDPLLDESRKNSESVPPVTVNSVSPPPQFIEEVFEKIDQDQLSNELNDESKEEIQVTEIPSIFSPSESNQHIEKNEVTNMPDVEKPIQPTANPIFIETAVTESVYLGDDEHEHVTDEKLVKLDDDLQSFEEWKKVQIQSQEDAASIENLVSSPRTIRTKKTQMNYASQDCGAKVLSHSSGAKNVAAILDENKDLYMLNPCSDHIWFVVELCEPIQVVQFQLANLELFSSLPHLFNLHISERFPAREWRSLGTFEARNERAVQTFVSKRDEVMFAKYLKFEMKSHFGNEHFCPLTLIRVFGVSMVEEYENHEEEKALKQKSSDEEEITPTLSTENEQEVKFEESVESPVEEQPGSIGKVLNLVKNAVDNFLGNGKPSYDNATSDTLSLDQVNKTTPAQANATEEGIDSQWESPITLVTNKTEVEQISDAVRQRPVITLIETGDGQELSLYSSFPPLYSLGFLRRFSSNELSANLCWFLEFVYRVSIISCLAPHRKNSTVSASMSFPVEVSLDPSKNNVKKLEETISEETSFILIKKQRQEISDRLENTESIEFPSVDRPPSLKETPNSTKIGKQNSTIQNEDQDITISTSDVSAPVQNTNSYDTSDSPDEERNPSDEIENLIGEMNDVRPVCDKEINATPPPPEIESKNATKSNNENTQSSSYENSNTLKPVDSTKSSLSDEIPIENQNMDKTFSEKVLTPADGLSPPSVENTQTILTSESSSTSTTIDELMNGKDVTTPIPSTIEQNENKSEDTVVINPAANQKESVLMRLSNRIRALEQNLSLSSEYLETLSRRYKRQTDEMHRAFNQTQNRLKEMSLVVEENNLRNAEAISIEKEKTEYLKKALLDMDESMEQLNRNMIARHLCLMVIEGVILIAICISCFGTRQLSIQRKVEACEKRIDEIMIMNKQKLSNGFSRKNSLSFNQNSKRLANTSNHDVANDFRLLNVPDHPKSTLSIDQLSSLFTSSSNSSISNTSLQYQRKKSLKALGTPVKKKKNNTVGKVVKPTAKLSNCSLTSSNSCWTTEFIRDQKSKKTSKNQAKRNCKNLAQGKSNPECSNKENIFATSNTCYSNTQFWRKCTSFSALVGKAR